MRKVLAGVLFIPRVLFRGTFRRIRVRDRWQLFKQLFVSGLVLFTVSGFVRDLANLDGHLLDGIEIMRNYWQDALEFLDRAPWLVIVLVRGFDLALVWLFLRAVASFHLRFPMYLDALALLRVNLRQGVIWTSVMQLRLLLALPVAVTLTILLPGQWSLLALGFALFSLWYLGTAFNPVSVEKMMDLLVRASMAGRHDPSIMDDASNQR